MRVSITWKRSRIAVNGLRDALREPKLIAEYVKTYESERRRLASETNAKRAKLEARLGEIRRALNRLVDALADGIATASSVKDRLLELEAEKSRIEAEIAETQPELDAMALHSTAMARYLEQIENLAEALKSGGLNHGSAVAAFRSLVASVIVHPVEPLTPLDLEIEGDLAKLISAPELPPSGRYSGFEVVAEEGLEPPTYGL